MHTAVCTLTLEMTGSMWTFVATFFAHTPWSLHARALEIYLHMCSVSLHNVLCFFAHALRVFTCALQLPDSALGVFTFELQSVHSHCLIVNPQIAHPIWSIFLAEVTDLWDSLISLLLMFKYRSRYWLWHFLRRIADGLMKVLIRYWVKPCQYRW